MQTGHDTLAAVVERQKGDGPFTGVVRVSLDGRTFFEQAWGERNRAERLPCTPDTRFGMASGSKTFTAVAVCRLVDRGAASLDDSLHDHLDVDLSGIDRGVTVRRLLTHTSGVADYFDEEEVLQPAGMGDSGYFATDDLPPRTALGYVKTGDGWKTNVFSVPAVGQPDGGAFTTAPDMERFWDALLGGVLLSPGLSAELLGPQVEVSGGEGYGLGVWTRELADGRTLRYASGTDPGVRFNSGFLDDGALKVTVIRNSDGPGWRVFMGLVDELAEFLHPMEGDGSGTGL
ncbi:MAG: serine hydrolase [Candidatus Eisenbacteria bacterium]|nr:serine hydrolase [Candidatus Eisenbacteria bacterium]